MIVLPVLLGIFSTGEAQDLTCPTGVVKPSSFYVVGASGGDIKVGTLNTFKNISNVSKKLYLRQPVKIQRLRLLPVLQLG